jgi:phosphinothricin acetyltransferase
LRIALGEWRPDSYGQFFGVPVQAVTPLAPWPASYNRHAGRQFLSRHFATRIDPMQALGHEGAPEILVRKATPFDVAAIREIYRYYVLHALATFEEIPPDNRKMLAQMRQVKTAGLPFLTAVVEGKVLGYAYASPYRSRPAYRYTVEDSVYVMEGCHGRGIGRALLSNLITCCEAGPWRQMVAIIGDSQNVKSIALHELFGFRRVGILEAVGFKLGRYVDTVIMQRNLG